MFPAAEGGAEDDPLPKKEGDPLPLGGDFSPEGDPLPGVLRPPERAPLLGVDVPLPGEGDARPGSPLLGVEGVREGPPVADPPPTLN